MYLKSWDSETSREHYKLGGLASFLNKIAKKTILTLHVNHFTRMYRVHIHQKTVLICFLNAHSNKWNQLAAIVA